VNVAHPEAPFLELRHQVVERVLELREDEQALVRVVEEALPLEQFLEPGQFRLGTAVLDGLRLARKLPQSPDLLADLFDIPREGDGLKQILQSLAIRLLHLLGFFG